MTVSTSAGTTLSVSTSLPASYGAYDYQRLPYTEVGEVTNIGDISVSANLVNHNSLTERRTQKLKGSINSGSFELTIGRDVLDAGQQILKQVNDDSTKVTLRIAFPGTNVMYIPAIVSGYNTSTGGADQITGRTVTVDIIDAILEFEPTTGSSLDLDFVNNTYSLFDGETWV